MSRSRASAKAAGSRFESQIAQTLAMTLDDDRIERRALCGNKDRGDIGGVRIHGQRLVIECKNVSKPDLAGWMAETEIERGNDDALAGVIVHKRHGKGDPLDQWVTCTVRELIAIIGGQRIEEV